MGLFSDNFYTWLDRRYAQTVFDDESMSEHDRHYHPNGFNPKTDSCNKREEEKDTDSVEKDNPPFTEETLKSRFGIKVHPFDDIEEMEGCTKFSTPSLIEEWKKYAIKPKEEDRQKTISEVGRVLSDIEKKFGCRIKVDNLLIADFTTKDGKYGIGGFSLADRIATPESIMVISANPPMWDGFTYGNKGSDQKPNIIRHELAHTLTTQPVIDKFERFQMGLTKEWPNNLINRMMAMWASPYAVMTGDSREGIAEVFTRVTDSTYRFGKLPKDLEDLIVHDMLGGER